MMLAIHFPLAFAALVCASAALAAPQRLDCVLTDTEAKPRSESRPIVVVFDPEAKTVTATEGARSYNFTRVSISNVSINGHADNVSLGIDQSSLGIVWQQYEADKVNTEFGRCRSTQAP
jgi:hypothetical protein